MKKPWQIAKGWRICGTEKEPRIIHAKKGIIYEMTAEVLPRLLGRLKSSERIPARAMGFIENSETWREPQVDLGPGPYSLDDVHMDITARCNMACPHCYQECGPNEEQDLDPDLAIGVIEQAKELGGARIALSGGEAVLHPDLERIMEAIDENEMVFTALFTNGLAITPEIIAKTKPHTMILFSYSPAINQICDLKTIAETAKSRRVTVSTVTKDGSELMEMYDQLAPLGIMRWRIGVTRPVGRGKGPGHRFDAEKVVATYRQLFNCYIEEYKAGKHPFEFQLGFAFQSTFLDQKRINLYPDGATCCLYKVGSMSVKWDGTVTPCSMDWTEVGRATDLRSAWLNMENSFRGIVAKEIEGCKDCEIINLCNGGCRACVENPMKDVDPIGCFTYKFLQEIMPTLQEMGVKLEKEKV